MKRVENYNKAKRITKNYLELFERIMSLDITFSVFSASVISKSLLIVSFFLLFIQPTQANTNVTLERLNTLSLYSQNAYIINLESDTPIYEKESNEKVSPASLTKLMTALVVRDYVKNDELNTTVTITSDMLTPLANTGATMNDLRANDIVSIYDLLLGMLIQSGADSSNALASFIEGFTNISFSELMNDKAKQLGMGNSYFVNAHGLDDENQYSTASDLSLLGKEILSDNLLETILSTYQTSIQVQGRNSRVIPVRGSLLLMNDTSNLYLPQVIWGKTGYTKDAQRCVLTYLKQGDMSFLVILMKAPIPLVNYHHATNHDLRQITQELFSNYKLLTYSSDMTTDRPLLHGKLINTIHIEPTRESVLFVSNDTSIIDITSEYQIPMEIIAPVQQGETLGTLDFYAHGRKISSIPMVSTNTYESIYDTAGLTLIQRTLNRYWHIMLLALLFYQSYVNQRQSKLKSMTRRKKAFEHYYDKPRRRSEKTDSMED